MVNKSRKKPRRAKGLRNSPGSSAELIKGTDQGNLPNNIANELETSFHIVDHNRADLPSPCIPVTEGTNQVPAQHKSTEDSPREGALRRRIRTLTLNSARPSPELKRRSWETKSSSANSSRVWSSSYRDSVATQDTASPEHSPSGSAIIEDLKAKRRSDRGASPAKLSASSSALKYIRSPNDYMFVDFDYCEAQAAMNRAPSNDQLAREPEIGKSSFDELLAYVRRMTGTEVATISVNDPKAPRRPNDARPWNHRNLSCVDCRESCPICNTTCCMKEELARQAADENLSLDKVQQAKRLLKIIEYLGFYNKDVSTFAQCTPPDGCGRYVCPSCCGICPSEICRDIQCKECKPKPWKSCDWHD
ncbi:uncharacterized protein BDV17DRAFT_205695 [Aspergillus undulatus]|uniref:uncharacterized protein n=1 Tax=Aspergillus undulatus TaxID=1810928 RepID=UPI003CCE49B4